MIVTYDRQNIIIVQATVWVIFHQQGYFWKLIVTFFVEMKEPKDFATFWANFCLGFFYIYT